MRPLITVIIGIAVMLMITLGSAHAQKGQGPWDAAVRYVMQLPSSKVDSGAVVFEVENTPGRSPEALPDSIRVQLEQVAMRVGYRPGSLSRVMTCPPYPPPEVRKFGEHLECTFQPGVALVVQVDEPVQTREGTTLRVTTWRPWRSKETGRPFVILRSRQLLMEATEAREWRVVKVLLEIENAL